MNNKQQGHCIYAQRVLVIWNVRVNVVRDELIENMFDKCYYSGILKCIYVPNPKNDRFDMSRGYLERYS